MSRPTLIAVAAIFGFAAGAAAVEQAGVDLAKLAGWGIVVAKDASPSETYVAEEFRSIFAQATGIELPTVTAPERADRHVFNPRLTPEQRQRIASAKNVNNSDIDFCEYQARVVIFYSWGNQQGVEHLAETVYEGSLAEFLRGWFPEKTR
jgi:hypothetical protein